MKKYKAGIFIRYLLVALVILMGVSVGAAFRFYGMVNPTRAGLKKELKHEGGTINILVVGVDDVERTHRADTIMIVNVDLDSKEICVISIPRDTRVYIEGKGWGKINHAYAYGGIKLLKRTLINLLGIPIHYYIRVDYSSFVKFVDLIGGVKINVKKRLYYVDKAGNTYINIPAGVQLLDGKKALGYVRFRMDAAGDIGRIRRQQKFAKAVLEKLKSPSILPKLPQLIREVATMIDTDMKLELMLKLASYFKDIGSQNICFLTLPGKPAYIGRVSYWLADLKDFSKKVEEAKQKLKESGKATLTVSSSDITLKAEDVKANVPRIPVVVLNGDGTRGLASTIGELLKSIGVEVIDVGNANHFDYKHSVIVYSSENNIDDAKKLAKLLDINYLKLDYKRNKDELVLIVGHDYKKIKERIQVLKKEISK